MNISEAGNAQILLNWLLGGGQQTQETVDTQRAQRARQAAQELADRSHRALQTGWTSATVAAAWPRSEVSSHAQRGDRGQELLDHPAVAFQHPSEGEDQ